MSARTERETGRFHAREEEEEEEEVCVLAGLCTVWPCLFSICCIPPFLLPLPSFSAARPPPPFNNPLFIFLPGRRRGGPHNAGGRGEIINRTQTHSMTGRLRSAHLSPCVLAHVCLSASCVCTSRTERAGPVGNLRLFDLAICYLYLVRLCSFTNYTRRFVTSRPHSSYKPGSFSVQANDASPTGHRSDMFPPPSLSKFSEV